MEIRCGPSLSLRDRDILQRRRNCPPPSRPRRLSRIYVPVSQPPIELMRIWAPWRRGVFTCLHFEAAVAPSEVTGHSHATHAVNWNCKGCQNSLSDDANKDQSDVHTTTKSLRRNRTIIHPVVQMICVVFNVSMFLKA